MSTILTYIVTALGGVLAGFALAGSLLWHQQQALTRARHDATHDDTTGLPDRSALTGALRQALTRGTPCGLVLLDLDDFKAINDTLGHEVGNDLLAAVGQRLNALPGPMDVAARLSGDEFALLVHGDTDTIAGVARRAWQAISTAPIPVGSTDIAVHASVGHPTAHLGLSVRDPLRHADQAMYHAKISTSGIAAYNATTAADQPAGRRCRDRRRW